MEFKIFLLITNVIHVNLLALLVFFEENTCASCSENKYISENGLCVCEEGYTENSEGECVDDNDFNANGCINFCLE